jgi:hypothetical protein
LPDRLVSVPKAAKARQAAERLALGCGAFDYVVSNEVGEPYSPAVLSRYWRDAVQAAGVRHIKFHAAGTRAPPSPRARAAQCPSRPARVRSSANHGLLTDH